ncbi:MAG TPA: hypothetical protein VME86_09005 [Acidobacteriaceae bacterium]|nr:hypothetical protein [Acidobacteriaceae bacterium]
MPLCSRRIVFSASYLADLQAERGPGYLFTIENHTARPIRLAEPVPSSAHWYARVGNKWLWRASSGSGGALVDAVNKNGPLFAYRPSSASADPRYMTVPAHGKVQWTSGENDNPALAYQPSCSHCNYPGERDYKAVFAYAYLPPAGQRVKGLLSCGLRTNLVDMPPKPHTK